MDTPRISVPIGIYCPGSPTRYKNSGDYSLQCSASVKMLTMIPMHSSSDLMSWDSLTKPRRSYRNLEIPTPETNGHSRSMYYSESDRANPPLTSPHEPPNRLPAPPQHSPHVPTRDLLHLTHVDTLEPSKRLRNHRHMPAAPTSFGDCPDSRASSVGRSVSGLKGDVGDLHPLIV